MGECQRCCRLHLAEVIGECRRCCTEWIWLSGHQCSALCQYLLHMLLIVREYYGAWSWSRRANRLAGEDHTLRKVPLSPSEITQKHLTQHKDRENLLRERTLGWTEVTCAKRRAHIWSRARPIPGPICTWPHWAPCRQMEYILEYAFLILEYLREKSKRQVKLEEPFSQIWTFS